MINIITPKTKENKYHKISVPVVNTVMSDSSYNDMLLHGYELENIIVTKDKVKGITVYDYLFRKEEN